MDERRRQLERAANQGDPQARSRMLLERMRAGEVTNDDLIAAANLGDQEAAAAISQRPDQSHPSTLQEFQQWLGSVTPHKDDALNRSYLALARTIYEQTHQQSKDVVLEQALDMAEEFLLLRPTITDPSVEIIGEHNVGEAADAVVARAEQLMTRLYPMPGDVDDLTEEEVARLTKEHAVARVISYVAYRFSGRTVAPENSVLRTVVSALAVDEPQAFGSMRAIVQAELLPWVLNERDPLRERVEARGVARSQAARQAEQAQQADEVRQRLDEQHPQQ